MKTSQMKSPSPVHTTSVAAGADQTYSLEPSKCLPSTPSTLTLGTVDSTSGSFRKLQKHQQSRRRVNKTTSTPFRRCKTRSNDSASTSAISPFQNASTMSSSRRGYTTGAEYTAAPAAAAAGAGYQLVYNNPAMCYLAVIQPIAPGQTGPAAEKLKQMAAQYQRLAAAAAVQCNDDDDVEKLTSTAAGSNAPITWPVAGQRGAYDAMTSLGHNQTYYDNCPTYDGNASATTVASYVRNYNFDTRMSEVSAAAAAAAGNCHQQSGAISSCRQQQYLEASTSTSNDSRQIANSYNNNNNNNAYCKITAPKQPAKATSDSIETELQTVYQYPYQLSDCYYDGHGNSATCWPSEQPLQHRAVVYANASDNNNTDTCYGANVSSAADQWNLVRTQNTYNQRSSVTSSSNPLNQYLQCFPWQAGNVPSSSSRTSWFHDSTSNADRFTGSSPTALQTDDVTVASDSDTTTKSSGELFIMDLASSTTSSSCRLDVY